MGATKKSSKSNSQFDEEDDGDEEDVTIKASDLIVSYTQLIFLKYNPESQTRSWLKKHGKDHCIVFKDEELSKLREYFNSLDDDKSGSIGVDELEDPLIALGLVDNRQQVQQIV